MIVSKTRYLTIIALLGGMALMVQPAQAQFGLAIGLNFDDLGDIDARNTKTTFDQASGYHIGAFYNFNLGPLGLRPGIFYRDLGDVSVGGALTGDFDLQLIEIPIDVRYRIPTPVFSPYILAGPVFSFPSSGEDDADDSLEDFLLTGNLGFGIEFTVPGLGWKLFPEFRYAFGLSDLIKDEFSVAGRVFVADDAATLNTYMLRLGIGF